MQRTFFASVAILLILATAVGHWRNLLCNVPFALMGSVLAVGLTCAQLSLASLVGFITLFGVTMRNSILLLNHYEHLNLYLMPVLALRFGRFCPTTLHPMEVSNGYFGSALVVLTAARNSRNEPSGPEQYRYRQDWNVKLWEPQPMRQST